MCHKNVKFSTFIIHKNQDLWRFTLHRGLKSEKNMQTTGFFSSLVLSNFDFPTLRCRATPYWLPQRLKSTFLKKFFDPKIQKFFFKNVGFPFLDHFSMFNQQKIYMNIINLGQIFFFSTIILGIIFTNFIFIYKIYQH